MIPKPLRWLRRNLFAKPFDALLSLIILPALGWFIYSFMAWVFGAAHWSVLASSAKVLMAGIYPADQMWRAWLSAAIIAAIFGAGLGCVLAPSLRGLALSACIGIASGALLHAGGVADGLNVAGCISIGLMLWHVVTVTPRARRYVLPGALLGLAVIMTVLSRPGFDVWGGLLLSVILTLTTSVFTIPLGILLAFGRQSRIASLRICCTAYIEVMRSVPLILVVYWIWIIVPLLAPDTTIPGILRGMLGYALFFAAYVAEYVRSGFQALPRGQIEAARSLGMSTFRVNTDIVLPQALRVVVPALVGQILDIFNGATLVFIIGLTDFLRAGQMILADPQHSNKLYEVYIFMFAVYFLIGSSITFASRRLERHLGRGTR